MAATWPAAGPRKLWSRDLGEGYSAIVAESGRLYTMYRLPASFWQFGKKDQEIVIAMDAATGRAVGTAIGDLAEFLGARDIAYGETVPPEWRAHLPE